MYEFRIVTKRDVLQAQLLSRVYLAASGCWEWCKTKRGGYGLFQYAGKRQNAHRVSYEAFVAPIPTGMVVRHTCDNPGCINPNHLLIGTMADNAADREARGRRDVKGEQIGTSKLTERDVLEIRASKLSLNVLSKQYGVHTTNIWAIRSGKSWRHLIAAETVGENDGR